MKDWKDTLVSPSMPLKAAIATMETSALRVVIVVDEQRRPLGTLTDGDVRRALLKQVAMDVPVGEVMCRSPVLARHDWSREQALAVMEAKQILHLPIVDSEGRIVGLDTLHGLVGQRRLDNPIFLMAGGLGRRLHPLTIDCPKPMLHIGGKPILEVILKSFADQGFHRFYICTHYMPETIRAHFENGSKWGVSVSYVHEDRPLGTGGGVGLLPRNEVDHPVIVMNCDLLTTLNYKRLLDFHSASGGVATMCVRELEHQIPYGVVTSDGQRVREIDEKPIHKYFVNAGVYVLSTELVHSIEPMRRIDMTEILQNSIHTGHAVAMFPIQEYWLDIGRMDDYRRAQAEFERLFNG